MKISLLLLSESYSASSTSSSIILNQLLKITNFNFRCNIVLFKKK